MIGASNTAQAAEAPPLRRLFYYTLGFARDKTLRRILHLAGYDLRLGLPQKGEAVAVWGKSPTARRGERIAAARGAELIRIEDAFLRSMRPGRLGDPPLGVIIDPIGVHFDAATPSLLETILAKNPLDDTQLLARAKAGIARLAALDLSKYNLHDPNLPLPAPGYVLVLDQTRGDASVTHGGADAQTFAEMLTAAMDENPGARIVIKAHPETALGLRGGHFSAADAKGRISLISAPVSPAALLNGAIAVYTVTSQMGFEAILAGHKPHVFGTPFYAGWGLSHDRAPCLRRGRNLTRAQLFAAAMILAPTWYDPFRRRLCSFEETVDILAAEVRSLREDRAGYVGVGLRAWKRGRMQAIFGQHRPMIFAQSAEAGRAHAAQTGRRLMSWGAEGAGLHVEDGFLRSRGLGAALTPPLSLVCDDLGMYFDPSRPSRLEAVMAAPCPPEARARAEVLRAGILQTGVTKYNLATAAAPLPDSAGQLRLLVPGQVEDDASIRLGAGQVRSNLDLLRAARAAYPGAFIIYKPHPDVAAGLRKGKIFGAEAASLADCIAQESSAHALLAQVDHVFTITSTLGFEALVRGLGVTCLGLPFYAGWGLTTDIDDGHHADARARRRAAIGQDAPDLLQLIHAALIAYPRYYDPVLRRPCPPEVALYRLGTGQAARGGLTLRLVSKLQGRFASFAHWWR